MHRGRMQLSQPWSMSTHHSMTFRVSGGHLRRSQSHHTRATTHAQEPSSAATHASAALRLFST
eukprot:5666562-Pleurochrysis_carterae.AAC.1